MTPSEAKSLREKIQAIKASSAVYLPSNVTFKVLDFVFDEESEAAIKVLANKGRTHHVPFRWLDKNSYEKVIKYIRSFELGLCDLAITLKQTKEGFEPSATIEVTFTSSSDTGPENLGSYVEKPLELLPYNVNGITYRVRKEGYTLLCAPTGGGKTFNALKNIPMLSEHFDEVLYLNYELSKQDIVNRAKKMKVDLSKVSAWDNTNIDGVLKYVKDKKVAIIVDNIDNLVGATADTYMEQVRFIQELDRFLKNTNNHALILTQFVKDNSIKLFDSEGNFSSEVNQNIVSGAKQISNNARSGIFAAYNPIDGEYQSTWLKRGEGKTDSDLLEDYMKGA